MNPTVDELLREGATALPRRDGLPDPRREAHWLLARAWGVDELWLRLHPGSAAAADVVDRFRGWLGRRAAGEPAHHLTASCDFWGREFAVSPAVLVPRPETELVVATALELGVAGGARVLDVGAGSGCLAVTLAAERPGWRVVAVDRSLEALGLAAANAARHKAVVGLLCGDLCDAIDGGFELVVANLPYVPTAELATLPIEVRHDPVVALDGGGDGLDLVRALIADLPRLLTPCGGAVLELGDGQIERAIASAEAVGLAVARRLRDVAGCERVLVVQRR